MVDLSIVDNNVVENVPFVAQLREYAGYQRFSEYSCFEHFSVNTSGIMYPENGRANPRSGVNNMLFLGG